ncbi:HNH endonuclease [Algihabitans albus]
MERQDGGADLATANLATTCDVCHTHKTNQRRSSTRSMDT